MNFYIKKNSTLPVLTVEVTVDNGTTFRNSTDSFSSSTITFSMKEVNSDIYTIIGKSVTVKEKYSTGDSPFKSYFLETQFTSKETKKTGSFIGEFKITNDNGTEILPIKEEIQIIVLDSFANLDLCCRPNRPKPTPIYPSSSPTPTVTPTVSITPTITPTVTITPSQTPSTSVTQTPTQTPTASVTQTPSQTPTTSVTQTPSTSVTQTPSQTPTTSVTQTPTQTPTTSVTQTPTQTPTTSVTQTPTQTPTTSVTQTPSQTPTTSVTQTPSQTPTTSVTQTPTQTPTTSVTQTPSQTPTTSVTQTPSQTPTTSVTQTPTTSVTQTPSQTPTTSVTQTPSQTPPVSVTQTPSQTPTTSVTQTPSQTPTTSVTQTPSQTPTTSVTQTPSQTPTTSVTQTPSQTPTTSITQTPSQTPTTSVTQTPSQTPTTSVTQTPSQTPTTSVTQTPSQTPTTSVTQTPSQTPTTSVTQTPSQTPTTSITQTPSQTPTTSITQTPSQTPTTSITPTVSITPTPTPTPSIDTVSLFELCDGVPCTETDIVYGELTDPDDIVDNWTRFSFLSGINIRVRQGSTYVSEPTGLQTDDTMLSGDSTYYFYTGSTKYKGALSLTMEEGENVGPTSPSPVEGDFYYNTNINKFVIYHPSNPNLVWTTFNPTVNTGLSTGNPTAAQGLTTSNQWGTNNLTDSQFTISGDSNIVVTASTKILDAGGTSKMIECKRNSGLYNGFYSTCPYIEYTHEVTLGSTVNDDDAIGLVLAAIKDDAGVYGPSGQTHTLQLQFIQTSPANESARIRFNQNNNLQAFNNGSGSVSTRIWEGTGPFGGGGTDYNLLGNVRIKVIKSGTTFTIYTTDTMGSQSNANISPGSSNPYSQLVSFDLTDKDTWTDAPTYAVGDELERFTGATKFGYLTSSQNETQFFDIVFSGSQQTNDDVIYTDSLTNPDEYNVSVFNEFDGCWEYVEEVTGYTGTLETVSLNTGYTSCGICP